MAQVDNLGYVFVGRIVNDGLPYSVMGDDRDIDITDGDRVFDSQAAAYNYLAESGGIAANTEVYLAAVVPIERVPENDS